MSTTVSYKGQTLATVSNQTKTLLTEGKYLEDDITLVDVSGGGATLITKSISANGTYNASSDSADGYSQVTVAVPNSYSAGDEGKVVSNGALVAQTSDTVTTNDTYDTTLINSLTVNVSGGGGSGLTTIASGTYTGTGGSISTAGNGFFIGKKMPQTNFWFKFKAQEDTEFAYDTYYKWAYGAVVVFSEFGHFDLSATGDGKQMLSDIAYDINNSGTITSADAGTPIYSLDFVRNGSAKNPNIPNNLRIDRRSDGFYIRPFHSNANYYYPSGVKYDWEVVYFGSNPSTDIVEIP